MSEKKVTVWAKPGGIMMAKESGKMRDKMADKKVIVLAKLGGIKKDKMWALLSYYCDYCRWNSICCANSLCGPALHACTEF